MDLLKCFTECDWVYQAFAAHCRRPCCLDTPCPKKGSCWKGRAARSGLQGLPREASPSHDQLQAESARVSPPEARRARSRWKPVRAQKARYKRLVASLRGQFWVKPGHGRKAVLALTLVMWPS